jgi:ubiquinone/menaquinone biosynthesis C-methylase UbiE
MASSGNWFESAYRGIPLWDIGRAQPAIARLAENGEIRGRVLDIGCGTGENALYLARRGHQVVGVDGAPTAIRKATAKAQERSIAARFEVADALHLAIPEHRFDTVIDSGLFHVFSDDDRPLFRESLARVMDPRGTYFMMCFSDRQPGDWGPRRVSQAEIRSTFAEGWRINYIQPSAFDMTEGKALAWLSSISRQPAGAVRS